MYLKNDRQAKPCKWCGEMVFWYTDEYGEHHCYEKRGEPNTWHYCAKSPWLNSRSVSVSNIERDFSVKQTVLSYPKREIEIMHESRQVWTYAVGQVTGTAQNQKLVPGQEVRIKKFLESALHQTMERITLQGFLECHNNEIEFFDVWLPTNQVIDAHIKPGVEFSNRIESISTIQSKRIWFLDHLIREI